MFGRDVSAWVEVRVRDGSWRTLPTAEFMSHEPPRRQEPPRQPPSRYVRDADEDDVLRRADAGQGRATARGPGRVAGRRARGGQLALAALGAARRRGVVHPAVQVGPPSATPDRGQVVGAVGRWLARASGHRARPGPGVSRTVWPAVSRPAASAGAPPSPRPPTPASSVLGLLPTSWWRTTGARSKPSDGRCSATAAPCAGCGRSGARRRCCPGCGAADDSASAERVADVAQQFCHGRLGIVGHRARGRSAECVLRGRRPRSRPPIRRR